MKSAVFYLIMIITFISVGAQAISEEDRFVKENASGNWKLSFDDNGTGNWQKKWFVDGVRESIENSSRGMLLPFAFQPHNLLPNKKSFH